MKIIKLCLLTISLTFIGNLLCAAAMNDALKSFIDSENESYIPDGEEGFKKVLNLIHSPEYKAQKAQGPVRNKNGMTLLYMAIKLIRPDIVQLLLNNEEDIYNVDGTGQDAMLVALKVQRDKVHIAATAFLSELNSDSAAVQQMHKDQQKLERQINFIIKLINDRIRMNDPKLQAEYLEQSLPETMLKDIQKIILEYL